MSQPALVCRILPTSSRAGLRLCGVHYRRVRWRHHWAGGSHHRWKRRSSRMRWNGHCGHGDFGHHPSQRQRLSIVMSRWPTRSGCRMQSCWLPRGVPVTRMITRWRSINGLYKAEVIHRQARKKRSEVELATLAWGLVQQSSVAGTTWSHPSDRGRKAYYASIEQRFCSLNFPNLTLSGENRGGSSMKRPPGGALGRRNYMFFSSGGGGDGAAVMYSLIGSCKLNGIRPEQLRHVIPASSTLARQPA